MSGQTEISYRDFVVRRVKYQPAAGDAGCMGFPIDHVYRIEDEFGDSGIPDILQQVFWSPADATQAIDFYHELKPYFEQNLRQWATTLAFEFNRMLAFRRNSVFVLLAIHKMTAKLREADEFGDSITNAQVQEFINELNHNKYRIKGA